MCVPLRAPISFDQSCAHARVWAGRSGICSGGSTLGVTIIWTSHSFYDTPWSSCIFLVSKIPRARKQHHARAIVAAASVFIFNGALKKRSTWVKGFRWEHNHSPSKKSLHENYPEELRTYLRMDVAQFDQLLGEKVPPIIRKQDTVQWATKVMTPASMYFLWKQGSWLLWPTVLRLSFSPEPRLTATLNNLAHLCSNYNLPSPSKRSTKALYFFHNKISRNSWKMGLAQINQLLISPLFSA